MNNPLLIDELNTRIKRLENLVNYLMVTRTSYQPALFDQKCYSPVADQDGLQIQVDINYPENS